MGPDQAEIIGFARPPAHAIIATMIVDSRLTDAWARLPDYLGSHVLVSLTALTIGLGISLPVAIASRRRPILRGALLTVASVVQTIPGLAFLALFYPLLLASPPCPNGCLAKASPHSDFFRRYWRSRSIRCCRCYATRHRPQRRRCAPERSRARYRRAAVAVIARHRTPASAAGHHGRYQNVGCLGHRHCNARDADRANEPRQLHLHRLADPEFGIRYLRLCCGRVLALAVDQLLALYR